MRILRKSFFTHVEYFFCHFADPVLIFTIQMSFLMSILWMSDLWSLVCHLKFGMRCRKLCSRFQFEIEVSTFPFPDFNSRFQLRDFKFRYFIFMTREFLHCISNFNFVNSFSEIMFTTFRIKLGFQNGVHRNVEITFVFISVESCTHGMPHRLFDFISKCQFTNNIISFQSHDSMSTEKYFWYTLW